VEDALWKLLGEVEDKTEPSQNAHTIAALRQDFNLKKSTL
jgi:hypothetical protein